MNELFLIINNKEWLNITDNINSWKEFIKQKPEISSAELCFRSHRETLNLTNGMYLAKGGYGLSGGQYGDAIIYGFRDNDVIVRQIWKTPELIIIDSIVEDINKYNQSEQYYERIPI